MVFLLVFCLVQVCNFCIRLMLWFLWLCMQMMVLWLVWVMCCIVFLSCGWQLQCSELNILFVMYLECICISGGLLFVSLFMLSMMCFWLFVVLWKLWMMNLLWGVGRWVEMMCLIFMVWGYCCCLGEILFCLGQVVVFILIVGDWYGLDD